MLRVDVGTATSVGLPSAARRSPSSFFLSLCVIAISASATIGATRCSAQDVADASRQERARKEAQQKKSKHVYTDEDLKRAQILMPEDREQVEAKKNQTAPPNDIKTQDAVDVESLPTKAPLGDIARQVRRQKDAQELHRAQQFPLPLTEAPVLASPKPLLRTVHPLLPGTSPDSPPFAKSAPPRIAPIRPPVKRSPFSRPKIFRSTPPLILDSEPALPSFSAPRSSGPMAHAKPPVHIAPVQPTAGIARSDSTKLAIVTVKLGDSLWELAQQNLGQGLRWQELLAINPDIRDANHIEAGWQVVLPATDSSRTVTSLTVQNGDSLAKIARAHFGYASSWPCIARANPSIANPNLIYPGQTLTLPASCPP